MTINNIPPFVTVIMPVRNEENFIRTSLNAVMCQDYPSGSFEVLVADGMSEDGTRGYIQSFQRQYPNLFLIDNLAHIVPAGLNIGLRKARGEIIVRVDGHCVIAPDFISCCVKHLQKEDINGVGGSVETIGESWLPQSIAIAMSSSFGVGGSTFRTLKDMQMYTDSIPFPAYTQETIRIVGLYDEEMYCNEDDEYNYRLRKLGMKLLLASDIKSYYYCRGSLNSLWMQYYRYGFWKVRVLQKHPRQMSPRQFVPPIFVLSLIVSALFALSFIFYPSSFIIVLSSFIPALYLIANLLASIWTAIKKGVILHPSSFILPVIFAILHLSYGLGFLAGLFKFWNRWGDKIGKTPVWTNEPSG